MTFKNFSHLTVLNCRGLDCHYIQRSHNRHEVKVDNFSFPFAVDAISPAWLSLR